VDYSKDKKVLFTIIIVLVLLVLTLLLLYASADAECLEKSRVLYDALNVCYGSGRALPIYNIS